jgi:hypothetical protein
MGTASKKAAARLRRIYPRSWIMEESVLNRVPQCGTHPFRFIFCHLFVAKSADNTRQIAPYRPFISGASLLLSIACEGEGTRTPLFGKHARQLAAS